MTIGLSIQEKRRLYRYLVERDGNKCLYCKKAFKSTREPIIEHLDDDRKNNNWDNLALAHQACNIEKANQVTAEYIDIALEKLDENQKHIFVGESFFEKETSESDLSTEIQISNKCYDIVEDYLTTEIQKNGCISYKETISNLVYLCRQKIKHGSNQSIRSHIQTLTSQLAPFVIDKDEKGKKIIKKKPSS